MLDVLYEWPCASHMKINPTKSNAMHYKPNNVNRTNFVFKCGPDNLECVQKYVYLGLTLQENLDYSVTAKFVAQSASRALGLLIAKYKSLGRMPYNVFTKLFDSLVWSVVAYGTTIWGNKSFSCIDSIQHRAICLFLGTSRSLRQHP
jgi:hypothetical protein